MPTFGDTTNGGDAFPTSAGRALVDRATLTEAATLTASWIYCAAGTTAGTNTKGLIYSDATGPANRQAVSAARAMVASTWVSGALSGSLSAADYWVGEVGDNGTAYYGEDATGVAPDANMANGTVTYASPEATWPGSDATYAVTVNAYVEYTAGGGAATSILLPNRSVRMLPYLLFRNALKERFSRYRPFLPDDFNTWVLMEHFRARGLLSNRGAYAR